MADVVRVIEPYNHVQNHAIYLSNAIFIVDKLLLGSFKGHS